MDAANLAIGLQVYAWMGFALATAISVGRYTLRLKTHRTLFVDDFIHIFVLFVLCGFAICRLFDQVYSLRDEWDPALLLPIYNTRWREQAIVSTVETSFYWAVVFGSKAVFLVCFGRVFRRYWKVRTYVYVSAAITAIGFLAAFLSQFFICGGDAKDYTKLVKDEPCQNYERYSQDITIIAIVCNVVTYLLIISLPIFMFPKLKVRTQQKVAISTGLLLGLGTVAVSVLAWVYGTWVAGPSSELAYLEALLCTILSALPAYARRLRGRASYRDNDGDDTVDDSDAERRASAWARGQTQHGNADGTTRHDLETGNGKSKPRKAMAATGGSPDEKTTSTTSEDTKERDSEPHQFIHVDVPPTSRSYWSIPGIRLSTRTTDLLPPHDQS